MSLRRKIANRTPVRDALFSQCRLPMHAERPGQPNRRLEYPQACTMLGDPDALNVKATKLVGVHPKSAISQSDP